MTTMPKLVILAISALVIVATGVVIHFQGKPYGVGLFALHKILTLLVVGLVVWLAMGVRSALGLGSLDILLLTLTGISLLAAMGSGGAMSVHGTITSAMTWTHRLAAGGSLCLGALTVYRLVAR